MTDSDKLIEAFAARHAALVKATGLLVAEVCALLVRKAVCSPGEIAALSRDLSEQLEGHLTSSAEKADRLTWSADELEAEALHHLLKHLRSFS